MSENYLLVLPEDTLEQVERRLILWTLTRLNGNRARTADALRISIRTLRNKLSAYRSQNYIVGNAP